MSARRPIFNALVAPFAGNLPVGHDEAKQMLDAHAAEVIAERDTQIIAWLAKKAGEYGTSNRENRAKAEAVGRMADKLSRGAVRPTNAIVTPADITVYRASHDSIDMGLYTTRQAAYEHCEAHELRDDPVSPMSWNVDEDGVAELVRIRVPRSPGAESPTGFVVTPLTVASEYDEEADE